MESTYSSSRLPLVTFLDVEASGLRRPCSYPIDIWSYWDRQAEALHGITRDQLFEDGITVVDAACRLNDMLGVERVYCDAWSCDGFWLDRLFRAAGMAPSFLLTDVFELYGALGAELAGEMVRKLREITATHRAREDAERYATAYREVVAGHRK